MFIENLRHAKKKGRVWIGILLGLIVISLIASFSFMGRSVDVNNAAAESGDLLENAENNAKAAEASAKSADGDATLLGDAASAYLTLGAYQEIYLESADKSYKKALKYAEKMVAACGSTQDADYETAYTYVMNANKGLGNADAISAAFNEGLPLVGNSQSFIYNYYSAMSALGSYETLNSDLGALLTDLEKEAESEKDSAKDKDKDADEDGEDADIDTVSASDLMEYVESLIAQTGAMQQQQ